MSTMQISNAGDDLLVEMQRSFGDDSISLKILIPMQNHTLMEAQALALEKAAEHVSTLAASIRRQVTDEQILQTARQIAKSPAAG